LFAAGLLTSRATSDRRLRLRWLQLPVRRPVTNL